jgi:hypothetical protein
MSINDYIYSIIAEQHRQDFLAEAANDRLARLATAGHTPWWHRFGHGLTLARRPVLTPRHSTR